MTQEEISFPQGIGINILSFNPNDNQSREKL